MTDPTINLAGHSFAGPRDLKIIVSPAPGVGASTVCPVLTVDGFDDVELFAPDADSDSEYPQVSEAMIRRGREIGADLILTTDPAGEQMGCAAPLTMNPSGDWGTFTGNQLGGMLTDFVLENSTRTPESYVVKTLVTTELIRRIADSYNVKTYGNLPAGLESIAGQVETMGSDRFLFGAEESHRYVAGINARDKLGAMACMLMAELAARVKADGKSLHDKLESLHWQHGYHSERTVNLFVDEPAGTVPMQSLMRKFREQPPASLAGIDVIAVRDYQSLTTTKASSEKESLQTPAANLVILDLAEPGNYVAVQPSDTETNVKFHMFAFVPAEQLSLMDMTRDEMSARLSGFETDLRAFAETV